MQDKVGLEMKEKIAKYEVVLMTSHNYLPPPRKIQRVLQRYCCCGATVKRITPIKEIKEGNPVGVV